MDRSGNIKLSQEQLDGLAAKITAIRDLSRRADEQIPRLYRELYDAEGGYQKVINQAMGVIDECLTEIARELEN